jgi:Flp pilus assembly protein TadG
VELALMISIVGFPLLAGTVELGTMVYDSIEVSNAAHAGAMFGMMSLSYAGDTSGITTAARGDAPDFGTAVAVTPTLYYACSSNIAGTQYSTLTAANSACTGSVNHSLAFVKVTTILNVTPPIRLPMLPATYTLVGVSIMEVEG